MTQLQFASINGVTLHYRREGQSEGVPLVFINSLGTDLRIWDGIMPAFADHYPLIRYDQRGHGLSDVPPGPYTIRALADDLSGLLDYLQVEAAILIGVSVGGMVALDMANRQPERVKALVLCDTAPTIGTAEMWHERISTLRQHGMAYLGDTILGRWFAPAFINQHRATYRGYFNLLTRTPLDGYIATCEAIRDADLSGVVGSIHIPALVVGGADDLATPPDQVRGLAEALPQARFELIEGAGHIPSLEQPTVLAAKIQQFLRSVADSPKKY
ncbi:MAG: 3-oxoadipate enol-lactonase [Anaerolineae bacterium]